MNPTVRKLLTVAGRVMLATIFLLSAVGNKIPKFPATADYMAANGVPAPQLMLVGGILFLLLGSISVVLGFRARIGATLLAVFLILATYYFHPVWNFAPDSPEFQTQMIQFMKNLSMLGAMLMIIANGAGPASLDNRSAANEANSPSD